MACSAARRPISSTSASSNNSKPTVRPVDSRPDEDRHAACDTRHREEGADLVVLGEHTIGVGDQDAATGVAGGPTPGDRAALGPSGFVGEGEQADLGRLGDVLGRDSYWAERSTSIGETATTFAPPPPQPRRSGLGGGRQPPPRRGRCERSPWYRRRQPGCRRLGRSLVNSSTRPSSSTADEERLSSTNTSANSPPFALGGQWLMSS